jgi:peptide-methionine (S)-S-oxide reductase
MNCIRALTLKGTTDFMYHTHTSHDIKSSPETIALCSTHVKLVILIGYELGNAVQEQRSKESNNRCKGCISIKMNDGLLKKAAFAAGCFWGVEAAFRQVNGVVDTQVGYMGGSVDAPNYKLVCSGRTGHAEALEVTFDPAIVSYEQLLDLFWSIHDPTQMNRQGVDVGSQYRSVIFYHDEEQREKAIVSKQRIQRSGQFSKPVVTEIVPASHFWRAEEYHQRYAEKHGGASCHI